MNTLQAISKVEAESLAFFDPEARIFGFAQPGNAWFLRDGQMVAYSDSVKLDAIDAKNWTAEMTAMKGSFQLGWKSAPTPQAELQSNPEQVCVVTGNVSESGGDDVKLKCFGSATLARESNGARPPVIRSLTAVFDEKNALIMNAYKPAVYHGHGDERNDAILIENGVAIAVHEVRLSTVYDARDRHVQANLEIWLEEDGFPRRIVGEAIEGTHLEIPARDTTMSFYEWRMGPMIGSGYYEIAMSAPPRVAA